MFNTILKYFPFFTDAEVPHTVSARPDTGLYSAKLGIWLFLVQRFASMVEQADQEMVVRLYTPELLML